jgi:hypothetical protein
MPRFHFGSTTCRAILAVVIPLSVFNGCFQSGESSGPFDNERLQRLQDAKKQQLRLIVTNNIATPNSVREVKPTEQQMTNLVAALSPIKSVRVGKLPANKVNYILSFQPGRKIVTFQVYLAADHLVYAERQYLYEGGDSSAFQKLADDITAENTWDLSGAVEEKIVPPANMAPYMQRKD